MIWVILCKDKPNSFKKRMDVIDDHRKYLSTNPIKTLISGPLTNETGEIMKGSFFMVEADNIEEIKEFQFNDPIYKACLLYTSPSPRDQRGSRMPSSA